MYIVENILVACYVSIFGSALLLFSIRYYVMLFRMSCFVWTNNYVLFFQR